MEDLQLELINFALTISAAVIVPLITAVVYKMLQKLNLEVGAQQQAKINYMVQQAVLEAEEWAAAKIKAKIPVALNKKLERAVTNIVNKVPNITDEEAVQLIQAELPKVGLGAANFLKSVTEAAKK